MSAGAEFSVSPRVKAEFSVNPKDGVMRPVSYDQDVTNSNDLIGLRDNLACSGVIFARPNRLENNFYLSWAQFGHPHSFWGLVDSQSREEISYEMFMKKFGRFLFKFRNPSTLFPTSTAVQSLEVVGRDNPKIALSLRIDPAIDATRSFMARKLAFLLESCGIPNPKAFLSSSRLGRELSVGKPSLVILGSLASNSPIPKNNISGMRVELSTPHLTHVKFSTP